MKDNCSGNKITESELSLLRTSEDFIVVQSRLLAPSYAGPGRWVFVHMPTRRSFLATGPDVVPEALKIAIAAVNSGRELPTIASQKGITTDQIGRLIEFGLLTDKTIPNRSFTELYHLFSYNYPFQDYGAADWRKRDLELMREYAKSSEPPEVQSSFEGQKYSLIDWNLEEFLENEITKNLTTLDTLSFVLKFTFAKIGDVSSSFLKCIRRTSPSGGARHPTDAIVVIRSDKIGVPVGQYYYDPTDHTLTLKSSVPEPTDISDISIHFISTVERAMWRYRDVRAYRPILIDLGHVVETFNHAAKAVKLNFRMVMSATPSEGDIDWLKRPRFVSCHINQSSDNQHIDEKFPDDVNLVDFKQPAEQHNNLSSYLVNPFLFFRSADGKFEAITSWPKDSSIEISTEDFALFNHCVPSHRGDRDNSVIYLRSSMGLSEERIDQFIESGILLEQETALDAYRYVQMWSRYGWYLSALQCVQAQMQRSGSSSSLLIAQNDNSLFDPISLKDLLSRRTCRSFSDKCISQEDLEAVISAGLADSGVWASLIAFNVKGLDACVYLIEEKGGFKKSDRNITREEVAAVTIGQNPSSSGSVTIWLFSTLDSGIGGLAYEKSIINLGRAGQRICIEAEHRGIGVFMTPALSEENTLKLLNIDRDPKQQLPYLLSLGYKK